MHKFSISVLIRLAMAVLLSLGCLWATWQSVRFGLSRMFAGYGLLSGELAPVDQALRLVPTDPEARVNRAVLLSQRGEHNEAVAELERATQLRPRDYYLWLELGMARDRAGDVDNAERAFRESKRLAPHYAQPAWQLGNLLFRAHRQDEAFSELVRAVKTDSTFLPSVIGLTWATYQSPTAVKQMLKPQTAFEHRTLAHFFATHDAAAEAVEEFRSAGVPERDETVRLINELIGRRAFRAAHEVWASEYLGESANADSSGSPMYDGGFEKPLGVDDPGFGWRVSPSIANINLSLDPNNPREGAKSLRIDFRGVSNPTVAIVSQIILVDPKTHYRLRFASRTQELLSGGLPVVVVIDALPPNVTLLESPSLTSGTDPWHESIVEFTTGAQTQAIQLLVRRKFCESEPCPIFGSLWVDAFSLRKL